MNRAVQSLRYRGLMCIVDSNYRSHQVLIDKTKPYRISAFVLSSLLLHKAAVSPRVPVPNVPPMKPTYDTLAPQSDALEELQTVLSKIRDSLSNFSPRHPPSQKNSLWFDTLDAEMFIKKDIETTDDLAK